MNKLPRNMKLTAFDPHRKEFVCKYEADASPPITPEAELLFQKGLIATSYDLWPKQRDYKAAGEFWRQAAELGHWKATLNLADLYLKGEGVPRSSEQAVLLVEGLMRKGVPAAFDKMGTYHFRGLGVKGDSDRAYAFWQLAADMGSSAAQAYLGSKIDGTYDNPGQGFWGNRTIALKMLECGLAQGNGDAAFHLGLTTNGDNPSIGENYSRSLHALHDSVKFGSSRGADYLSASFDQVRPLTGNAIDNTRAERYAVLGDALRLNPDLRFPNLDKILPLPPAELPMWDGKRETLIDAAKGLVIVPKPAPTPGSQRTGRAYIPQGQTLVPPKYPHRPVEANLPVPLTGYWQPRLIKVYRDFQLDWQNAQVPQHYTQGESFDSMDRSSMGKYAKYAPRTVWQFAGLPAVLPVRTHVRVARGLARTTLAPEPTLRCVGALPCPRTGVWFGQIPQDHPRAALYNTQDRFAYLEKGQPFPDPKNQYVGVEPHEVKWLWLDNANQIGPSSLVSITLTNLHPIEGEPRG